MSTGYFVDVRIFIPADRKDRRSVLAASEYIDAVKPTLVDAGYQVVRVEDAWTTKGPEIDPRAEMEQGRMV